MNNASAFSVHQPQPQLCGCASISLLGSFFAVPVHTSSFQQHLVEFSEEGGQVCQRREVDLLQKAETITLGANLTFCGKFMRVRALISLLGSIFVARTEPGWFSFSLDAYITGWEQYLMIRAEFLWGNRAVVEREKKHFTATWWGRILWAHCEARPTTYFLGDFWIRWPSYEPILFILSLILFTGHVQEYLLTDICFGLSPSHSGNMLLKEIVGFHLQTIFTML